MSRRILPFLLPALLAASIAACGSKGPLVMPDQQTTSKKKHAAKPASAPATPAAPTTPTNPAQPTPASDDGSGPPQ